MKKEIWVQQRRRELLYGSTEAEKALYRIVKSWGLNVVRQYPIDTGRKIYFADIYIPRYKLVIEIDGGYHNTSNQKRLDVNRSSGIRRLGYKVYRLPNKKAYSENDVANKLHLLMTEK